MVGGFGEIFKIAKVLREMLEVMRRFWAHFSQWEKSAFCCFLFGNVFFAYYGLFVALENPEIWFWCVVIFTIFGFFVFLLISMIEAFIFCLVERFIKIKNVLLKSIIMGFGFSLYYLLLVRIFLFPVHTYSEKFCVLTVYSIVTLVTMVLYVCLMMRSLGNRN